MWSDRCSRDIHIGMAKARPRQRPARRLIAGRYELRNRTGRDALGVIWSGIDVLLRRDVLVKEVTAGSQLPEDERAPYHRHVIREARAVARINHPGAVTLYDVIQENGRMFIVNERMGGRPLAD